jgi:hypothetical protein
VRGEELVAAAADGFLYVLSVKDGSVRGLNWLGALPTSPAVLDGSGVLLGLSDKSIVRLRPASAPTGARFQLEHGIVTTAGEPVVRARALLGLGRVEEAREEAKRARRGPELAAVEMACGLEPSAEEIARGPLLFIDTLLAIGENHPIPVSPEAVIERAGGPAALLHAFELALQDRPEEARAELGTALRNLPAWPRLKRLEAVRDLKTYLKARLAGTP